MKQYIREYKEAVRQYLVKTYSIDELTAQRMIRDSYLSEALQLFPDIVLHDSVEYWGERVYMEDQELEEM